MAKPGVVQWLVVKMRSDCCLKAVDIKLDVGIIK